MEAVKRRIKRAISYAPYLEDHQEKVNVCILKKNCSRKEQVLHSQLRAGHCLKTRYYKKRVGLKRSA